MTKISTIRFVKREQLDVDKYNKLIDASQAVSIYCYSWYLDAVSDNWGCLVLGDYEVVFPFAYTVKFGQKIIYQPFFTREFTFFGINKVEEEVKRSFIEHIPIEYKKINFSLASELSIPKFDILKVVNQQLELGEGYESVYSDYSTNTKRLIKKALKSNCIIEESADVDWFISFFKENTGAQVNYTKQDYKNLRQLVNELIGRKKGALYQVKIKEQVVAQGVFLFQDHRVTYLKGTANPEGKKCGAMFLLMDFVIKENKTTASVFDFGGSKVESIAEFYKKFGAKDSVYYQYSKNEQSWLLKKGKIVRDLLKK